MNTLEFGLEPAEEPRASPGLGIHVDWTPLQELVAAVELPYAKAEGHPDLAGSYAGLLELGDVCWPSRHFLDRPALPGPGAGETLLLGCTCGHWGCWPLTARVEVTPSTVTWHAFRNAQRADWDLSALGPFVYDRRQYEAALRQTRNFVSL